MANVVQDLKDISLKVSNWATKHGADGAEVLVRDGSEMSIKVRKGETEVVQEAGSRALGLRVFKDKREAVTYTSDMRDTELEAFVQDTVDLAKIAEPDELNTLPEKELMATSHPDLQLFDENIHSIDAKSAIAKCIAGEKAAMGFDKRITNSDGASWGRVSGAMAFANSHGFCDGYQGSYVSFVVEPLCDDKDGKKRNGHWWTAARYVDQLEDVEAVGKEAARRTLAQLGASKIDTGDLPIVFDAEVARSIIGTIFSVANGSSFYRKSTYLVGRENTPIASDLVTIVDDPLIPKAPGSRPFDGEGLASRKNSVVEKGVLKTVLCDTYTARKLSRQSTGSASRGVGGGPGPSTSNFIMQKGNMSVEELLKDTKDGFYVTSMMGFGFNAVTGDFSRGASGFLIKNGKLDRPVSEVTISANFDDILKRIDAVADDLVFRTSTACPTFRVSHMTVAGK